MKTSVLVQIRWSELSCGVRSRAECAVAVLAKSCCGMPVERIVNGNGNRLQGVKTTPSSRAGVQVRMRRSSYGGQYGSKRPFWTCWRDIGHFVGCTTVDRKCAFGKLGADRREHVLYAGQVRLLDFCVLVEISSLAARILASRHALVKSAWKAHLSKDADKKKAALCFLA